MVFFVVVQMCMYVVGDGVEQVVDVCMLWQVDLVQCVVGQVFGMEMLCFLEQFYCWVYVQFVVDFVQVVDCCWFVVVLVWYVVFLCFFYF